MNSLEAAKTTGSRLLAILAVLMLATGITACGGGGGGGGSGTPTTGTFRFVNNSGVTISDLYLWEASQGTTRQGPDQLGTNVLVHGATFDVTKVPCKKGMYFRAQAVDSSWWTDVNLGGPKSVACGGTFIWTLGTGTGSPPPAPPPSPTTGKLTVYLSVDTGGGTVTLKVDGGAVYTFTQISPAGYTPPCGAASNGYAYTATVAAGSHTVSASNSNTNWPIRSVNVPAGGCYQLQLTATSPPPSTTGTLSVYLNVDAGGPVTLVVDGRAVYTFSQYYTTPPTCGAASNTAIYTATVAAGSHTVSASSSNRTWPGGTVNVPAGGCYMVRLY